MFGFRKPQPDLPSLADAAISDMYAQAKERDEDFSRLRKIMRNGVLIGCLVTAPWMAGLGIPATLTFAFIARLVADGTLALPQLLTTKRQLAALGSEKERRFRLGPPLSQPAAALPEQAQEDFNAAVNGGVTENVTVYRPLRLRKNMPSPTQASFTGV
jgi:hypothetical protein